jgi:hypothetical protein
VSYGITNTDDVQQVRGWYYIPAGSSRELSIGNRKKNEVFYVLMNEEGEVFESKNSTANFPTDRDKYFDSKIWYTDVCFFFRWGKKHLTKTT